MRMFTLSAQPYRPYSADEGDAFMSEFCHQCARANLHDGATEDPCGILGAMYWMRADDKDYPSELIKDENGARCTAFTPEGEDAHYICPDTLSLFGEKP